MIESNFNKLTELDYEKQESIPFKILRSGLGVLTAEYCYPTTLL